MLRLYFLWIFKGINTEEKSKYLASDSVQLKPYQ